MPSASTLQDKYGGISSSVLDVADVGLIDFDQLSQGFLRYFPHFAQIADVFGQSFERHRIASRKSLRE